MEAEAEAIGVEAEAEAFEKNRFHIPALNGARNTRSAHLISVLSSLGRALGQWGWACPDHHGSDSNAGGLVLGAFSRSCTNGALLLHRIASVALQNKPQNTLF